MAQMIQTGLIALNIIALLSMGLDKYLAIKHRWRISEQYLLWIALIGGSLGILTGMFIFHHKTRKRNFVIGVPILLMLHILLFWYFNA